MKKDYLKIMEAMDGDIVRCQCAGSEEVWIATVKEDYDTKDLYLYVADGDISYTPDGTEKMELLRNTVKTTEEQELYIGSKIFGIMPELGFCPDDYFDGYVSGMKIALIELNCPLELVNQVGERLKQYRDNAFIEIL